MKSFVALVSSEQYFLDRTKSLLEAGGYVVAAYADPEAVLHALATIRFDALVATLSLGASNGFAFAERVAALAPHMPVLLASRVARRAGIDGGKYGALLDYEFTRKAFEEKMRPAGVTAEQTRRTLEEIQVYLSTRQLAE